MMISLCDYCFTGRLGSMHDTNLSNPRRIRTCMKQVDMQTKRHDPALYNLHGTCSSGPLSSQERGRTTMRTSCRVWELTVNYKCPISNKNRDTIRSKCLLMLRKCHVTTCSHIPLVHICNCPAMLRRSALAMICKHTRYRHSS